MYLLLVAATLLVIGVSMHSAWKRSSDILHPAMLFSMPLGGLYVAQPLLLTFRDQEKLFQFLDVEDLLFVTTVNLIGVLALCLGAVGPRLHVRPRGLVVLASDNSKLWTIGIILGIMGVTSYIYCIYAVGGFYSAYAKGYGGGWSNLGYVREAYWACVPAISLISISRKKFRSVDYLCIALFTFPLLFHGIVGGRRGPTAAALLTVWLSRTLATGKRPGKLQFVAVMAGLGITLLLLIANRGMLSLSGESGDASGVESYATASGVSNEFIFGGGVIVSSHNQDFHYYGGRYAAVVFIRPIPVQLFPNKYQFASEFLGISNLSEQGDNMGTGRLEFRRWLGWSPAHGSAPGLIADLWLEVSYGYVIVLWMIGRFYWFAWHRAMHGNRFWGTAYIIMAALSIYLVMQTFEAMLFRFLLAAGFVCATWWIIDGRMPDFQWRFRRSTIVR